MVNKGVHSGFLFCMALILGGALGNVIDSTFYGVFLNNAPFDSPTKWFHGQVIDMLYFPLFTTTLPQWIPFKGGEEFSFFDPVFNIADSSIFMGVVIILIRQKYFFKESSLQTDDLAPSESANSNSDAPIVSSDDSTTGN
jgi:signal peptidase II